MTPHPLSPGLERDFTAQGQAGSALLVLKAGENARLLADFLRSHMQVSTASGPSDLDGPWDLVLFDVHGVNWIGEDNLESRKRLEEPMLLPYLLLPTAREQGQLPARHFQLFDEILPMPVGKAQLLARIARWLRIRRMTQTLEAQRADLEVFASAVAHELRAPLREISGFLAFACEELAAEGAGGARSDLEKARVLALSATELAKSLLNLARLGKDGVHLEVWPAGLVTEGALKSCRAEIQRTGATVEVSGENPQVLTDPMLAQVALTNYLQNALKFQAPGVAPNVRIRIATEGKRCRFSVEDNGVGVPPERLSRLFAPFTRAHGERYPGYGLGLATVVKIAKLLNGRVGATSTPGQGSVFWLELPIAEETGKDNENPAG